MSIKMPKQLNILMEMAAMVNSTLDPCLVRKHAIEAAMRLLDVEAGSLLLIDEETGELFFEITIDENGKILKQVRLKKGEGIAGWVAESGVPLIIANARKDPRFSPRFDAMSGFMTRKLICVPLKIKGKIIGVLEAINKIHGRFNQNDVEILGVLANQVAVALDNSLLHEENLAKLTEIVVKEKRHRLEKEKLIKDLHDGIGGITTNISLLSELAQKMDDLTAMKKSLSIISELAREGSAEIRSFMNCLENKEATWHDLVVEFRRHGHNMIEPHNITFSILDQVELLDDKPGIFLYLTLFRIFKEALANVIKHSKAQNVEARLYVNSEGLALTVRDDGIGIREGNSLGRGLVNMMARATEVGGTLVIEPGPGTSVQLDVPFPLQYPDKELAEEMLTF